MLTSSMPLWDNSYYLHREIYLLNNNYNNWDVIGKSEILNTLSCERVFIAVENWMERCSRTSGLILPQNENL